MDSPDLSLPHTLHSLHPLLPPPPPPPSTDANFPILAISILGILATSILLLIYYVFAVRCRLRWRRSDAVSRFSGSLRRPGGDRPVAYPAVAECRGLGASEIQAIPTFRYRSGKAGRALFHECAVCLNEFYKDERIRLLPNCFHVFHTDCIDMWLQTNANCPLCRAGVTTGSPVRLDHLMASIPGQESSGDVVIDVRDDGVEAAGEDKGGKAGGRHGSMGDECVGMKGSCDLHVQPMRRSYSVDSLMDRQLQVALEMILVQNLHLPEVSGVEESSGDGQVQRSFFSFQRRSHSVALS